VSRNWNLPQCSVLPLIEVYEMTKVQRQAKRKRPGSKKSRVKAVPKAKRAAPAATKAMRKRTAPNSASEQRQDHAPVAATIDPQVPAAVVAAPADKGQAFPLFWPALGLMRMWLGSRKTSRAEGS
jgi:hypothetical protein